MHSTISHEVGLRLAKCVVLTVVTSPLWNASPLAAQTAVSGTSATRCTIVGRAGRVAVGASVGAWLGFVAAKISLSDWSDGSQGSSATRFRNRATIGGALAGAMLVGMTRRTSRCDPTLRAVPMPLRSSRLPITMEEIQRSAVSGTVYELVNALRHSWLNVRGVETLSEGARVATNADGQEVVIPGEPKLIVYLDNAPLGTVSQLRSIPVVGVMEVRYFDGAEATYRWGAGHSHGAIQVLTMPQVLR